MQTVVRLINEFKPKNYQLSIKLDRINRKFYGNVKITGSSNSETITLHSKDLQINSIKVDNNPSSYEFGENDALIISSIKNIDNDRIIDIDFEGKITDSMHGLYPCYYEHDGIKKELLATQFESHHAREVFPCVDEPAAKATFDLTLITETDVTVLGNMPIKKQSNDENLMTTTFDTTPLMSSYLLAWVVGELHKKTAKTKSGVEVNIWSTPAQPIQNLDFALDIATRSIDFYNDYFDTPYPLPKCDHVALPDFSSGAMENWGLITYRETTLLADPATTSISSKHHIAMVIAHELSHQWFGNLVTMNWWNDLWLNESFATLIEYVCIDALEPTWQIWLDFASSESIAALRRDSIAGVQSVQTDVNHPDEIGTLFDGAIVYAKGARLLGMLRNYIGESAFQAGLKQYFKIYAYQNTEAIDLWNCLSQSSHKDIAGLMTKWISNPGYPVIYVSKNGNKISLSQKKLSYNIDDKSEDIWPITINSNCIDLPVLFYSQSIDVETSKESYVELNVGNYAHFITHYSKDLMNELINQIKIGQILPIDRLKILNEQIILARAGIISSADLIPLINAYENETIESVWGIISATIDELRKFAENDPVIDAELRKLSGKIAKKQYQRLGWKITPGESMSDSKLRDIIISLMIYSEDTEVINISKDMYDNTPIDKLDPELRSLILSTNVRFRPNEKIIDKLLDIYQKTESAELKQDISIGITSTKDIDEINKLVGLIKDTELIRTQDTSRWIIYLIRNKYGKNTTWDWIRNNWEWIKETFNGDKSYDDYPRYTASALSNRSQLNEYIDFFTPLLTDNALKRAIEMGINEISNRVDVIEKDGAAVREALLNL